MKKNAKRFNVLIVDDHKIVRLGLESLLKHVNCIESVSFACNGKEALDQLARHQFDFIFMDVRMPVMDGITATRIITEKHPAINVIAISVYDETQCVKEMYANGAKAFLLKSSDKDEIETAIEKVLAGCFYVPHSIVDVVLNELTQSTTNGTTIQLTLREREVLCFLSQGMTSKSIASKLFLSKKTVDLCRSQLLGKTKCKKSTELVTYAMKHKLISCVL